MLTKSILPIISSCKLNLFNILHFHHNLQLQWVSLITAESKLIQMTKSVQNLLYRAKGPWIERRRLLNNIAISGKEALDRASIARMAIVRPSQRPLYIEKASIRVSKKKQLLLEKLKAYLLKTEMVKSEKRKQSAD